MSTIVKNPGRTIVQNLLSKDVERRPPRLGSEDTVTRALLAGLLLLSIVFAAAASARDQTRTFDLTSASVQNIQDAVDAGALTYERLVQLYLHRIEVYDEQGPTLNAVIHVNPHALAIARELDHERRSKGRRSVLHGIPLAVKDNVDTADLPTTGGSRAFEGSVPPRDATIIERLRRAGAIVLLKTNMDEFALGSQGLSTLGGQTLNPFDLRRSPGGSSGGTAVAVAAGFAALGIATETGMSVRGPAANTGLVGIAPTRGLVSRTGVIPISFTQDRVGVHARSVEDAALLLSALRGFDPEDLSTSVALGATEPQPYSDSLTEPVTGVRLGVLRDLFRPGNEFAAANALVDAAIARLRDHVAVVDGLTTGLDLVARAPALRLNNYEVRFAFDAYLQRRGPTSPVRSLSDLIATGKYLRSLESRYTEAMHVQTLDTDQKYLTALTGQRAVRDALLQLMDRERVDALAFPVKSLSAPLVGTAERGGPSDNPVSSIAGLPAVVLAAGTTADGLPIAIEFMGRPFSEAVLLRIAAVYERLRGPRPLPGTTPPLPGERISY